jgi:hypothetical protein
VNQPYNPLPAPACKSQTKRNKCGAKQNESIISHVLDRWSLVSPILEITRKIPHPPPGQYRIKPVTEKHETLTRVGSRRNGWTVREQPPKT